MRNAIKITKVFQLILAVVLIGFSAVKLGVDLERKQVEKVESRVMEIEETVDTFKIEKVEPIVKPVVKHIETLTLKDFAQEKMNDLIATGYFEHTNSNGCDFKCRAKPYLKYYSWVGENLYKGVCNVDYAYELWNNSESHLQVLKHPCNQEVLLVEEYSAGKCYMVLVRGVSIGY